MTAPTTMTPNVAIFAPLGKVAEQADGTLFVDFTASTETVDDQGEIVEYAAVKKAAADYMQWAALREMHQPTAAGTTVSLEMDDELKKVTGTAHVVDPTAIAKVQSGVYKGVSIGGQKLARVMSKVGGKSVPRITDIRWVELSLVDRPSNPDAVMSLAKRSDVAEEAPVAIETPAAAPVDEPPAAPAADVDAAATPPAPAVAAAEAANPDTDGASADPVAPGASVAVTPPAEPAAEPLEQAAATGDLAKAAANDAWDMASEAGYLLTLAEREEKEGDTDGAARIKRIAQTLLGEAATEADEVGTPENTAQLEAEAEAAASAVVVVDGFYYAAVTGDLAKRAVALAKAAGTGDPDPQLDTLISLAKSAGGRCEHDLVEAPATATLAQIAPETLAKFADAVFDRSSTALLQKISDAIGPLVRDEALVAMKGEILEAMAPLREELAKIAAQPASGGALRFAPTERFGVDGSMSLATEAEVLSKAAAAAADPAAKQAIGLLAAQAQIRADQAR
jgi:hypothetical protein